jgi:hypothetical protein
LFRGGRRSSGQRKWWVREEMESVGLDRASRSFGPIFEGKSRCRMALPGGETLRDGSRQYLARKTRVVPRLTGMVSYTLTLPVVSPFSSVCLSPSLLSLALFFSALVVTLSMYTSHLRALGEYIISNKLRSRTLNAFERVLSAQVNPSRSDFLGKKTQSLAQAAYKTHLRRLPSAPVLETSRMFTNRSFDTGLFQHS